MSKPVSKAAVVAVFVVTLVTVVCLVEWPLPTAAAAALVLAIYGVWTACR